MSAIGAGCGQLLLERATPSARAYANHTGEDSGEVTLICKAAGERHIRQRQSIIAQLLLGGLDAAGEKPAVRRRPDGAAKRAREMAHRQAALLSHLLERHTTIEIGAENFLGAPRLPRREAAPDRPWQRSHTAIRLRNMYPNRQEDVVDAQHADFDGTRERRQPRQS